MKHRTYLTAAFSAFWSCFWLLNGLDKFLSGKDLGLFLWHGKDRTIQFSTYFENINLPNAPIGTILALTGILEIAVAIPFLLCIPALISASEQKFRSGLMALQSALSLSFLVFLGFICFDIVAGDRAELLEHSTYLAVIAATFITGCLELALRNNRSLVV